jgi:hypothetical protein
VRSRFRTALAADEDRARTQPRPGEAYVMCKHIEGTPLTGFSNAHVVRVFDTTLRRPVGPRDVIMDEIPPAWFFLCDACMAKHDAGGDTEIVGYDDVWPEGAGEIRYIEREK